MAGLSTQILKADDTAIMLPDPEGRLVVAATAGFDGDKRGETRLALCEIAAGKTPQDKGPVIIDGPLAKDPRFAGMAGLRDIRSAIVFPLVLQGRLLGVLSANRTAREEPYTTSDLRYASVFCAQITQAIHNATLYRELDDKMRQLRQLQSQLIQSEKLAAIGKLAAGVAHEINNPLAGIMGFTELLLKGGGLSAGQREDLQSILEQGQRCTRIVQNLLQFSRVKKGNSETVDLGLLLEAALQLLKYDLVHSNVEVQKHFPADLPAVRGDAAQLEQVYLNLISNARQALEGKKDGLIKISASLEAGQVILRFEDNGHGISPENLGRVFDPFFTTKPVGQGTGLGLSISYGIIQQHNGTLRVESQAGAGTTFIISLPVTAKEPDKPAGGSMKTVFGLAIGFVLLICRPPAAMAADNSALGFFEEEAVVISSAKRAQKVTEAAANTGIITARNIELYGYRTLGEALQSLPGFYATNDRNYSYLWVRGFGRPGDYNSRILLLLNGHRMNDNIYGEAFTGQEFSVDMKSVSRIEVVKGPGAALYGDNAFFAVVNVITKSAQEEIGGRADAAGGSYGTHEEFADVAQRFKNGLDLYASGSYRNTEGQRLSYPEFSAVNGGVADKKADREKSGTFYLNLAGGGWTFQGNANSRLKAIPTASYGNTFNDSRTKTIDSRSFLELRKDAKLGESLGLTGRVYYDWYDYRGDYFFDNSAPPPAQFHNKDSAKSTWYGEEVRLQYDQGGENILIVGQEYEKNVLGNQSSGIVDPAQDIVDVNYAPYRWAVFAQQELKLRRSLRLTLGVRYDRYETFGHTINPRFAAVYNPWEGNVLKFMAGSAFRAPTPFERLYEWPGDSKANLSLKPETIATYEVYWEQQLPGRRGQVAVGYFDNRIKNLISQTTDPADGLTQFVNNESVSSRGVEVTSRLRLGDRISGHAGYILQNTREVGGNRLSNSPEHSGTAGLTGELPGMGASAGLELFVVGPRETFQATRLPAAALLSLKLSALLWKSGPRCHLAVYNLTNTAYKMSGAAEHAQAAILQDRRNYNLGLDYRF